MKLIFPLWVISFSLVFSVKWLNLTSFSKTENLTVVNVWLGWKVDALTVPEMFIISTVVQVLFLQYIVVSATEEDPTVPCVLYKQEERTVAQ